MESPRVFVFNGWAAEPETWSRCSFRRECVFSYLEQLDGVPSRVTAAFDSYVLVGFSMGASSAMRIFLDAPEKVRGLVLISATARMMEDKSTGWIGMSTHRRAALKYGTQLVNEGNPSPLFDEANLDRGLDFLQNTDLRAELAALPDSPSWPTIRKVPVAIFQSERDGIVRPNNAEFLKRCFPQAEVTMVPGNEHNLPVVIPEAIDTAVANVTCAAERGRSANVTGTAARGRSANVTGAPPRRNSANLKED